MPSYLPRMKFHRTAFDFSVSQVPDPPPYRTTKQGYQIMIISNHGFIQTIKNNDSSDFFRHTKLKSNLKDCHFTSIGDLKSPSLKEIKAIPNSFRSVYRKANIGKTQAQEHMNTPHVIVFTKILFSHFHSASSHRL